MVEQLPLLFSDHLVKRDSDGLGSLAPPPLLPWAGEREENHRGMGVFDLGGLNMKLVVGRGGYIKAQTCSIFPPERAAHFLPDNSEVQLLCI